MVVRYHRNVLKSTTIAFLTTAAASIISSSSLRTTIPLVAITTTTTTTTIASLYYSQSISQVNAIPTTNRNVSTSSAFVVVNPKGNTIHEQRKMSTSLSSSSSMIDPEYPGTAVERLQNVHHRIQELVSNNSLIDQEWESIRKQLLWAGGLRDLPNARPGQVRLYK
jgi:hypothetical protein